MSRENVEALRRLYAEWEKGNLWALRDVADPDIEWEWSEGLAAVSGGPRIYHGLEEIGAATAEFLQAWGFYWMTAEEFLDAATRWSCSCRPTLVPEAPIAYWNSASQGFGRCATDARCGSVTTRTRTKP